LSWESKSKGVTYVESGESTVKEEENANKIYWDEVDGEM